MNRVKPPYKFKSPYWTHDPAEKRFRILTFGPNGVFKEIGNSESNYYKACTLDLSIYKTTKMKEKIKQLRVEIDGLAQLCEGLKPITRYVGEVDPYKDDTIPSVLAFPNENSQEIKEAIKSLKLSKAWLGKVLEGLGSESPYKSGYKTVEDIEPEADKAKAVYGTAEISGRTSRLKAVDTFTLNGKVMNKYSEMSHIEKVDWLRTELKSLIERVDEPMSIDLSKISGSINVEKYIEKLNDMGIQFLDSKNIMGLNWMLMNKVKEYLTEARFWLGFELGRIRDESK